MPVLLSWQLRFNYVTFGTNANAIPPGTTATNVIPAGGWTNYLINVPANADVATNILVFATGPLNVWFNSANPSTAGQQFAVERRDQWHIGIEHLQRAHEHRARRHLLHRPAKSQCLPRNERVPGEFPLLPDNAGDPRRAGNEHRCGSHFRRWRGLLFGEGAAGRRLCHESAALFHRAGEHVVQSEPNRRCA